MYAGNPYMPENMGMLNETIEPIRAMLRANPKWANIFQDVAVNSEGDPYFTQPSNLSVFLELRAVMHRALYLNPHCRGFDLMYKMLISPMYSRNPHPDFPLNSENLLFYTDDELESIVNSHCNLEDKRGFSSPMGVLPDYEVATFFRPSDKIIKDLEEQDILVIGVETIRQFNPATDFLCLDSDDNQIKQYKEINPSHAAFLDRMVEKCNRTVVYYLPEEKLEEIGPKSKIRPVFEGIIQSIKDRNNGRLPVS